MKKSATTGTPEKSAGKGRRLLELFLTFFRIGLLTFGGGYAMIAVMEDICVEKKKWLTHDEMMNLVVIAESTPGPVAINGATYIGYRAAGFLGSVVSTLGVVFPSFMIIYLISLFLNRLLEIDLISNIFKGIRIGVGIIIIDVAVKMIKKLEKNVLSVVLLVSAFAAMLLIDLFAWNFSSILLLLAAGLVGLLAFLLTKGRWPEGGTK